MRRFWTSRSSSLDSVSFDGCRCFAQLMLTCDYIGFYGANTRSRISPLWMVWILRAWAASTYGGRTLGRPRTSRSSTTQGRDHAQHYVALLLLKAGRIGSFFYVQLMTLVILVYDLSRRIGCRDFFFSPPIIRDRAGAIRPDFSVCVESRARGQGGRRLL